jgi:hypothetical protein
LRGARDLSKKRNRTRSGLPDVAESRPHSRVNSR